MRPCKDVIKRIKHDAAIPSHVFVVGFLDRFAGLKEKPFEEFNFDDDYGSLGHLESAIPLSRVWYFKYGNRIVWDRRKDSVFDDFFGSFPKGNGMKIERIMALSPPAPRPEQQQASASVKSAENLVKNHDRPNYFVCFRILSRRVREIVGSIQRRFPAELQSGKIDMERLHVTLLTLRLKEADIERAVNTLAEINVNDLIDSEIPFRFEGVKSFGRGRVLYAAVDEEDGSTRNLTLLHEVLRNKMIAALGMQAWKGQEHGKFVPHMTIAKVNRSMSRKKLSFPQDMNDAGLEIGSSKLRALHLCKMEAPDGPGTFYETLASNICIARGLQRSLHLANGSEEAVHNVHEEVQILLNIHREIAVSFREIEAVTEKSNRKVMIVRGMPSVMKSSFIKRIFPEDAAIVHSFGEELVEFMKGNSSNTLVIDMPLPRVASYETIRRLCAVASVPLKVFEPENLEQNLKQQFWHNPEKAIEIFENWEADSSSISFTLEIECLSKPLQFQKIVIFDLDRTLLLTPRANKAWKKSRSLFFDMPQSFDETFTDGMILPGPALRFLHDALAENQACFVLTGRKESLRSEVEAILEKFGIRCAGLFMKPSFGISSTDFKSKCVALIAKLSGCEEVDHFEDELQVLSATKRYLAIVWPKGLYNAMDVNRFRQKESLESIKKIICDWIVETVAQDLRSINADASVDSVLFGSALYGRSSHDLDLCIICPAIDEKFTSRPLERLYRLIRRSAEPKGPYGIQIRDSHFSKRSKCPRIALEFVDDQGNFLIDVDIVLAEKLGKENNLEKLLKGKEVFCRDVESFNSLDGVTFALDLQGFLEQRKIATEDFRNLVDECDQVLRSAGLRGRHFQMIRTFQIAQLVRKYLEAEPANMTIAGFLGNSLPREEWIDVLQGVRDPEFSECNLIYVDDCRDTFRRTATNEQALSFEERATARGLSIMNLEFTCTRVWKLRIQLEAGFPRIVRAIIEESGQFMADGNGSLEFDKEHTCTLCLATCMPKEQVLEKMKKYLDFPPSTKVKVI